MSKSGTRGDTRAKSKRQDEGMGEGGRRGKWAGGKEHADRLWIIHKNIEQSARMLHPEDLRVSVETVIRVLEGDCEVHRLMNSWRAGVFRGVLITVGIVYASALYGWNAFIPGTNKRRSEHPDYRDRLIRQFGNEERYQREFPSWCTDELIRSHRANLLRLSSLPRATNGKDEWYEQREDGWYLVSKCEQNW